MEQQQLIHRCSDKLDKVGKVAACQKELENRGWAESLSLC